jgi:hypothetical protein
LQTVFWNRNAAHHSAERKFDAGGEQSERNPIDNHAQKLKIRYPASKERLPLFGAAGLFCVKYISNSNRSWAATPSRRLFAVSLLTRSA